MELTEFFADLSASYYILTVSAFTPETIMLAICLQIFLKKITNFTFMYFGYLLKVKYLILFTSQTPQKYMVIYMRQSR